MSRRASAKRKSYVESDAEPDLESDSSVASGEVESHGSVEIDENDDTSQGSQEEVVEVPPSKAARKRILTSNKISKKGKSSTEEFIPKLSALPAGKTPYSPSTIHPNTLLFLTDLKRNNERDWFQQRELQYHAAKNDFDSFVLEFAKVIARHDDTIPELPAKDLTFRIYRDVRFSNDRTPYKTNLSAAFSRTGRKGMWACYYLSIEPGKSMLGCGCWCPPAPMLGRMRADITENAASWHQVLDAPEFVQMFGKDAVHKEKDKLKTHPRDCEPDHPEIELMRLKSYTVGIDFKDDEIKSPDFMQILEVVIQTMVPFVTMLNDIIDPEAPDSDD